MSNLPKTKSIILEKDSECLRIWFNSPENRNALSGEVMEDLEATIKAVNNDLSIRTIILRGKGPIFCAGADIKGFRSNFQSGDSNIEEISHENQRMGHILDSFNQISQTIIVLIEGNPLLLPTNNDPSLSDTILHPSSPKFSLFSKSL